MKHFKYAVIILNYMSENDAVNAANNVIECAEINNYVICIADNASPKNQNLLRNIYLTNTFFIQLDSNRGYGQGNNHAVEYLKSFCTFEYIVIMNPDVLMRSKGLIENMICKIEKDKNKYAGAQPLTNTFSFSCAPEIQEEIRRVVNVWGTIIYTSSIWKRILRNRFRNITYYEQRPYCKDLDFEVPSGAFFMLRYDIFERIGGFDKDTFLYFEEFFIGYKVKQLGMCFRFCADVLVDHYQGKSTNARRGNMIPRHTNRNTVEAQTKYLENCLHTNRLLIKLVKWYLTLEYEVLRIIFIIYNKIKNCAH